MKKFTMPQIFPSLPNHLWNQPRGLGVLALLSSVFMFACGDAGTTENITNNYTSGMEIAEKVSDLPKCSADNAGEQYLVKADGEFYACNGKDWKALGGSGFAADYSCETKPLADDSGVAIYCGGDSIGVVQNGAKGERGEQGVAGADGKDGVDGKDGAQGLQGEKGEKGDTGEVGAAGTPGKDGKDGQNGTNGKDGVDGVGCKVVSQTEDAVTIQCGDDKFSMNLNGGSGDVVPGEDVVSLAKLSGVSQKGPFINGSTVTLFELDGSRSLVQTGRTFGGEIITDDGRFSVNNVSLKSSYVRMTANGFYRNEVTGKNSASSIVLNAYSDLQARSSVNINLLTHLEYYRVGYLMENALESTIKAAKKRAQKEIFAAFGIDNNGFGYSEDLDVFGEGDQNAALLAMSILLQGDRSEADLSALLASVGKDIEKDGKWDENAVTRAKIADWADSVDFGLKGSLTLSKIKSNVSGWGLGSVPNFEKYIRDFRNKEYGLGECNETNKNVVVRDTNGKSIYYASKYANDGKDDKMVRFICDEKSKLWRRATDIEKDTMGLGHDFSDGTMKNGLVNTDSVYVYDGGSWRSATTIERDTRQGCVSSMYGKNVVSKTEVSDYECTSNGWSIHKDSIEYAGQIYKTVRIGTQIWMAENLNYDPGDVSAMGKNAWSRCFDNDPKNCKTYGRLYTWEVAMNNATCGKTCNPTGIQQGICPSGWHIPSSSEWSALYYAMGNSLAAMREITWSSGLDTYGFSALPAGYWARSFAHLGYSTAWWSSTGTSSNNALCWIMGDDRAELSDHGGEALFAFFVRCLKD